MHVLGKILRYVAYVIFLPFWYLERLMPRDCKIMVFGSFAGKCYSDNSKAFFEYMILNHSEIRSVWITKSKTIENYLKAKNIDVYLRHSLKGVFYTLRAKYFISDHGNSDINHFLMNGAKKIYLWHGMPLKKMGYFDDEYLKMNKFYLPIEKINYYLCPYNRTIILIC